MIKYVYCCKNKKSGNFNAPIMQDFPKENAVEAYSISAKEAGGEALKELELYYLGTFDTKTGDYDQKEKEYLIDLGTVISGDGGSTESA